MIRAYDKGLWNYDAARRHSLVFLTYLYKRGRSDLPIEELDAGN
jgi:hypothetical protein